MRQVKAASLSLKYCDNPYPGQPVPVACLASVTLGCLEVFVVLALVSVVPKQEGRGHRRLRAHGAGHCAEREDGG